MSEKTIPFVVNDRRKFTSEGEVREGVDLSPTPEPAAAELASAEAHGSAPATPNLVEMPAPAAPFEEVAHQTQDPTLDGAALEEEALPPAPTAEQMEQSKRAFEATADRLETAVRAANPGADHPPALTFESLVQSVYMQAVLQLGGSAQQGEQPQIDLLGAKQSIDMLGLLADKTAGNLSKNEDLLLSSAVFELRLAFLEMTQALARSAQQRGPGGPGSPLTGSGEAPPAGFPGGRPGPSIVR